MGANSNPHVLTNLYTTANTNTLTNTKTKAVTTFANAFKPLSDGSSGLLLLLLLFCCERLRLLAKPRANAGNAKLCVNVNLCKLSLSEYGPTLPRAAALNKAYSKSKASNNEYRAVIVDERLLLSQASLLRLLVVVACTAAATDVNEDVVLDEGECMCPL